MMSPREQLQHIQRGTTTIIRPEELLSKLEERRPLRVKLGVDPNFPDIHLGHTVGLTKLRQFQDLGHQAVLIIGDFTAMIGDPSGRSTTRPQLTREEVLQAAATYEQQVFKILDRERTEVRFNGEWLGKLTFEDVVRLCAQSTVARMLERDDFAKRYAEGAPISIHEFLYPLMQAHDSVEVRADVELGGTDQTFNILLGRQLQKEAGQVPQVALILPLLEGTDGKQKMSKSLGNYIGVAESPDEMFGKLMSISDPLMVRYYELLTGEDTTALARSIEAGRVHPMEAKKRLGEMLVERFHGAAEATSARHRFEERFQQGHLDLQTVPEIEIRSDDASIWLPGLMREAGLVKSNSEARRLLKQHGVRVNGTTVSEEELPRGSETELLLEVGKRRAVRVRFAGSAGR
jgi:tyrosyl-tRNA synthetase